MKFNVSFEDHQFFVRELLNEKYSRKAKKNLDIFHREVTENIECWAQHAGNITMRSHGWTMPKGWMVSAIGNDCVTFSVDRILMKDCKNVLHMMNAVERNLIGCLKQDLRDEEGDDNE